MGSEVRLAAGEPRTYAAHGQAYAPIARVDLIRDGVVVHSVRAPRDLPPGWVRADFRIEWGEADVTTTWDGSLTVTADAGIVVPEFVGPEVTHISRNSVRWEHQTFSFGEPYGAQRGCVEVSIVGPRSGGVRVRTNGRDVRLTLGAIVDSLAAGGQSLDPADADHETLGTLRLQPSIGALESLERTELDLTWTDETPLDRPSFTYARLILEDGEMAWTSPIWVDPAGIDPDLPPAPPDQPTDAVGDAITYDI